MPTIDINSIYGGDLRIAIDSNRTYDNVGRLHISCSHISKASVNPYYGREIPNAKILGLDPDKTYRLLRDPAELAKAAPTFERLPILKKHIPVTAMAPKTELIVGAIGSDVAFNHPYLDADTCIWDATAIAGIETGVVREFSCGYFYVAVMEPGEFEGENYDGRMTNIRGNHLILCESGRAGNDVLAADSNLRIPMKITKLGKALITSLGMAFPRLAEDSAFLPSLVGQAANKTFDKPGAKAKIIAFDSKIPAEQLDMVFDALMDVESDPEPKEKAPKAEDAEPEHPKGCMCSDCKSARDAEPEETEAEKKKREKAEAKDAKTAKDAEEKSEAKTKAAMDELRADLRLAEQAKRDVRPVVGDVIAQDSAADIYTFALDQMKVKHEGVTGVPALKALFDLAHENSKTPAAGLRIAQDAGLKTTIETKFPGFNRVRRA